LMGIKVVGLTGTMGSGKQTVMQLIMKRVSCYHVTLSDVIRGEIEKKRGEMSREVLQNMGNEMRQKYGNHILALLAIEYLPRDKNMIVVDGIRNPGEVEYLKKKFGSDFSLISVDAPAEARFQRIQGRKDPKDPQTLEEFKKADARDKGQGEPPHGQHVGACVKMADFKITNSGTPKQLGQQVAEVTQKIVGR
jgi:dephospho-CoA kinase